MHEVDSTTIHARGYQHTLHGRWILCVYPRFAASLEKSVKPRSTLENWDDQATRCATGYRAQAIDHQLYTWKLLLYEYWPDELKNICIFIQQFHFLHGSEEFNACANATANKFTRRVWVSIQLNMLHTSLTILFSVSCDSNIVRWPASFWYSVVTRSALCIKLASITIRHYSSCICLPCWSFFISSASILIADSKNAILM